MGWERSTGQWRERDKGMKGVKKWMNGMWGRGGGRKGDQNDDGMSNKLGWKSKVSSKR
jgi:hypothetical protein